MSYLGKAKKQDLSALAGELNIEIDTNFKIVEIKDAILTSPNYDADFTKELLNTIISDRKEREERLEREFQASEKERELHAAEKEREFQAAEKEREFQASEKERELRAAEKEREFQAAEKERELRAAEKEREFQAAEKEREREFLAAEKEKERLFEIEKLKLQASAVNNNSDSNIPDSDTGLPKLELKKLIPSFNPKTDDMSLFLNLFEKQLTFVKVPVTKWVVYLIGLLPSDIAKLVAQETDSNAQDYEHIKEILLKRFKMSAEKFRQLFTQHRRSPDNTWRDHYYDLRNFFEGWLTETKVTNFEDLKDLMIADQMKKRAPPDYREHFIDHWADWIKPNELADKLDNYEEIKIVKSRNISQDPKKKEFPKIKPPAESRNLNFGSQKTKTFQPRNDIEDEIRPPLSCYGCGKIGVVRSRCPNCSPAEKVEPSEPSSVQFRSCSIREASTALLKITINGMNGTACADTGATHSIAGEELYHLLRRKGVKFKKMTLDIAFADGLRKDTEVLQTQVDIEIEGHFIRTDLFVLPTAKDNRTLLGMDFLSKAHIVLNVANNKWYFSTNPRQKFAFAKDRFRRDSEVNTIYLRGIEMASVHKDQNPIDHRVLKEDIYRPGEEGNPKIQVIDNLLEKFPNTFQPGEEKIPKVQHYAGTEENLSNLLPSCYLSPRQKELQIEKKTLSPRQKEFQFAQKTLSPRQKRLKIEGKNLSPGQKEFLYEEKKLSPGQKWLQNEKLKSQPVQRKPQATQKADLLPRPLCQPEVELCNLCAMSINLPSCNSQDVRDEQPKVKNSKKVLNSFQHTCKTTGQIAAHSQFGRKSQTVVDTTRDHYRVMNNDCSVPEITSYSKRIASYTKPFKGLVKESQTQHKLYADHYHKASPHLVKGNKVWVPCQPRTQTKKGITSKFLPRCDGPYVIMQQRSPTSHPIATADDPTTPMGNHHVSALIPCDGPDITPVAPSQRREPQSRVSANNPKDATPPSKLMSQMRHGRGPPCASLPQRIPPPQKSNLLLCQSAPETTTSRKVQPASRGRCRQLEGKYITNCIC